MLRGAALTVYKPLVDEALGRIQRTAAELLVSKAAVPERIKGISLGLPVTVSMSPPEAGVVIGFTKNPETGKDEAIVLVRGKGIVTAAPEELTPGLPATAATSEAASQTPQTSPVSLLEQEALVSKGSIHAGDLVQTPLGQGRVTTEPLPGGTTYTVDVAGKDVYHFQRSELRVVPPPTPT